jgi:hypothetical protein
VTPAISPGTLMQHSVWGLGKVVEVRPPHLLIHFPSLTTSAQGPRRKLQLTAAQLMISPLQSAPELDHIRLGTSTSVKAKRGTRRITPNSAASLDDSIAWFRQTYSGLFADPKLVEEELGYKRAAHDRFVALFGNGRGRALLAASDLVPIASGLDQLYRATNIPSQYEIMDAHDGFKSPEAGGRLLQAALDFIDFANATTFEQLVDAVVSLPGHGSRVLTWPNVTILPFLADPRRFMVLKPEMAKIMASRMGFDLLYSFPPKWHCYDALQRMSAILLDRLRPLGAIDYVDVQSFMWVTRKLP